MADAPPEEPPADPRDALIWEQARRIEAQARQIEALEAMVAGLRERLAAAERAGSRNSGNSSMPPSADDLPGRKPPRKQRRAAEGAEKKKSRGKQPGSRGTAMRWEVPDRTEDHYPEGACSCGRDLAEADTSIWPTNNISERGVRPLKTQQKISGRLTSDDVTQDRLDIRSYTDTARKHGRNAFTALCDLMTGKPWEPPARALST